MIRARVIAQASARPLSLATLRKHCEIVPIDVDGEGAEIHPDDDLLLTFLDAAVDHAEDYTGRAIALRTYELAADEFPVKGGVLELLRPPLVELLAFTYGTDLAAVPVDSYVLDAYGDAARLRIAAPGTAWPTVLAAPNTVRVQYRAGYSSEDDPDSDAEPLPGAIRAALLLIVGHLYRHREATIEKAMSELPLGVNALLRPKQVSIGMA